MIAYFHIAAEIFQTSLTKAPNQIILRSSWMVMFDHIFPFLVEQKSFIHKTGKYAIYFKVPDTQRNNFFFGFR